MQSDASPKLKWQVLAGIALWVVCSQALLVWGVLPVAQGMGLASATHQADSEQYYNIAENLANGNGYRAHPEMAETMHRSPGYVAVLTALIYLFPENSFLAASVLDMLLTLAIAGLVYVLARKLTGNVSLSLFAALLPCFHPFVILIQARVHLELFWTCLLLLYTLALFRLLETRLNGQIVIAGLLLGIAALTRSVAFYSLPFFAGYYLYANRHIQTTAKSMLQMALLLLVTMIVLSPWMYRNFELSGKPTFSESNGGWNIYAGQMLTRNPEGRSVFSYGLLQNDLGQAQAALTESWGIPYEKRHPSGSIWMYFPTIEDEIAHSNQLGLEAIKYYREHWELFLQHCLYNALRFWFLGATPTITAVCVILQLPLLVLAGFGCYVSWRRRINIAPILIIGATIYAIHIPLVAHARYTTPLIPFLSILLAIGLSATRLADIRLPSSFFKTAA